MAEVHAAMLYICRESSEMSVFACLCIATVLDSALLLVFYSIIMMVMREVDTLCVVSF